jgi:hypothetical protein
MLSLSYLQSYLCYLCLFASNGVTYILATSVTCGYLIRSRSYLHLNSCISNMHISYKKKDLLTPQPLHQTIRRYLGENEQSKLHYMQFEGNSTRWTIRTHYLKLLQWSRQGQNITVNHGWLLWSSSINDWAMMSIFFKALCTKVWYTFFNKHIAIYSSSSLIKLILYVR